MNSRMQDVEVLYDGGGSTSSTSGPDIGEQLPLQVSFFFGTCDYPLLGFGLCLLPFTKFASCFVLPLETAYLSLC